MVTVYGMAPSGNCWKAVQIPRLTGHPIRWVEVDANAGETRTPGFLAGSAVGKVPVVETEDGTVLAESNAILTHFAEGTPWLLSYDRWRTNCGGLSPSARSRTAGTGSSRCP